MGPLFAKVGGDLGVPFHVVIAFLFALVILGPTQRRRLFGLVSRAEFNFCALRAEMVKKAFEAVVSGSRVDSGRLISAPAVRYPIAIPANLIDLLD